MEEEVLDTLESRVEHSWGYADPTRSASFPTDGNKIMTRFAGLALIWSNGPTEGCIHRLKLIKRQAYGRAGVDFLRHRILPPSAGMAA
jgi:hypothetical protein